MKQLLSIHGRMMLVMTSLTLVYYVVWLLSYLVDTSTWLGGLQSLGFYPSSLGIKQMPWGLLTYPWLHLNPIQLATNLLLLWGLGRLYAREGKSHLVLRSFFLGSLSGGLVYALVVAILGWNYGDMTVGFPLYGASAGICALAFALAVERPRRSISIKGRQVNLLLLCVLLYVLSVLLRGDNLGGMYAHLGGAVYGIVLGIIAQRKPRVIEAKEPSDDPLRRAALEKLRTSGYTSLSREEQSKI